MKASIYRISLDIQDAYANVSLDVKRGDLGRRIHITLTEGGFPYKISPECYAVLSAEKPDGEKIFNHCTIEGNTIIYVMTPQTVAVAGIAECEVKVYGAYDQLLTSACFNLIVNETVNEEDKLVSETEVDALTHLISEATEAIYECEEIVKEGEALHEDLEAKQEDLAQKVSDANDSAKIAKASEAAAKASEQIAVQSANNASASEQATKKSENAAASSERNAKTYETNAKISEGNAMASEANAKDSENASANSEVKAKQSSEAATASAEVAKVAETNAKRSEDNAQASSRAAEQAAAQAENILNEIDSVIESATNPAAFVLRLSNDKAAAQANTDAVTAAVAKHKCVVLRPGNYPVKPGIVIESGRLDMNGAHLYSVDYKSSTPLVYLKGEAPEICNGELEGSYNLADDDEGYEFFEAECLIRPQGVNDAHIHNMDLHNNWGYCISPSEDYERVYVGTATKQGSNDFRFLSDVYEIPEGYKYVTAAGGVGYNYIISVIPVKYRFYDENGTEIKTLGGTPRERVAIPDGAKTVKFETTLDSESFVTYYAFFTNYTESLTVSDCKFHHYHSLGMANMPGSTTVTRCSFTDAGRPRSEATFTTRATTGGIDIEDVQTPLFVMSDCYSKDCLKLLMFGGYKGSIVNCIGDGIGIYRGWQCDLTNCNVGNIYTIGGHCRISMNGVHADKLGIKQENAKDIRGDISTNEIPVGNESKAFCSFDNFIVKMGQHRTPHGALSGRLNGTVRSVSNSGIRWNGFSSEKGSHVVIDSTILPTENGNYYGTLDVNGDAYGLESNVAFLPKGYTIHDSTFNIAAPTTAYVAKDGDLDGGFESCVFNLTGAAYFRRFTGKLTNPISLVFENCTINNADNYLFNYIPDAGGEVTFRNCTIADQGKLFNGDTSNLTINFTADDPVSDGKTPEKGVDYWTDEDKAEIVEDVKGSLTPEDIGAAGKNHGNHVPATQTANNATFLRNDNTWQKVTPAGIGMKTEPFVFTLEDGSTVTKAVYVG